MKKTLFILILLATLSVASAKKIKVACVGNSITYGMLVPEREINAYPFQLQRMLGEGYETGNFGHSGTTLLTKGHRPYTEQEEYRQALEFNPDIVVMHLGVNDTDPRNWPNYSDSFVTDYIALIDSFKNVNPNARFILALLSPLSATHYRFETGTRDWRISIQDAIRNVAEATGAELIDFDRPLRDRQNLLIDGIHPGAEGQTLIAETVYGAITGDYGGLKLPEIWQSGMVVQRNRPLEVKGKADAGAKVHAKVSGHTVSTTADNRGDWTLLLPPLAAGGPYTITFSDSKKNIELKDVLAGEVWIASGQSNMEFTLSQDKTFDGKIVEDPMFRVFDMKPIARTNAVLWSDSVLAKMDRLEHYRPTEWGAPDKSFSAVAYHFARALRDSLDIPVGVICNAVGGSPAESWVDINTLEANMPDILVRHRTNDYLQPWVQQRAGENTGDKKGNVHRHPYDPTYLFSSGIRPLNGFPVAGVIWYQGESNAHNTELHERIFPLVAESWRKEFASPSMPFYFVQLSSLNRPSWPVFRNSQRLLSKKIPFSGMAVSSDVGDSLDVHPRYKRPVGERLARIALNKNYGYGNIEYSGPEIAAAIAKPGCVMLSLDHAEGLTTSDGKSPRVFEIAEVEGLYYPADAKIESNNIILTNMEVKKPRFVRYAWQPFTRSNVVNAAGIPMSTVKMEVDNSADYEMENGYERGVSAPFFGTLDGKAVIAGGCNFPCDDPLAKDAVKQNYKGIYAADPVSMEWQRIGSLPEPMAYGASATLNNGIVMLGTDRRAWILTSQGLNSLPEMPEAIDNAAATAIGRTVYIAGGNINGKPSKRVYALDLDNGKWTRLKDMPGNPRVQPAVAASDGKLYVWGGFAGAHDGKPATLQTDGLVYDPEKGKWNSVKAPLDNEGNEVTLSGGAAVTLPDGKILAAGGVNKDVFLNAIRQLPEGYLFNPIEWYRFNPNVLVFNPADGNWEVYASDSETARAGAALICIPGQGGNKAQATVLQYGGELKPRIRTASTLKIK